MRWKDDKIAVFALYNTDAH